MDDRTGGRTSFLGSRDQRPLDLLL